jgi:hypothetical protein
MATDDPIDDDEVIDDESEDVDEIADDEGLDDGDDEPAIPALDETSKHTEATMPPGEGRNPKRNTM